MTTEIILTFVVLGITIFLFVSEWLRVDVVALCVMLALPWLGLARPGRAYDRKTGVKSDGGQVLFARQAPLDEAARFI